MSINCVTYSRVSTRNQDFSRQSNELLSYCNQMDYNVIEEITETVSGSKKNIERLGIQRILELSRSGLINKVIVLEISRLGRNTSEILNTLETLSNRGVSVVALNLKIETLLDNGNRNPISEILFTIISEFSRIERTLITERVISGIANARNNPNITLGRPIGSRKKKDVLLKENKKAVALLKQGFSIRQTATLSKRSPALMFKLKHLFTA